MKSKLNVSDTEIMFYYLKKGYGLLAYLCNKLLYYFHLNYIYRLV